MLPTDLKYLILSYINDNNYTLIIKLVNHYNDCTLTQSYNPNCFDLNLNLNLNQNNINFKFVKTAFTQYKGVTKVKFSYYKLIFIKPNINYNNKRLY